MNDEVLADSSDELPTTKPEVPRADGSAATSGGAVLAGRYCIGSLLGEGGHAQVWDALDALNGEHVAVKILRRGLDRQAARVRREVAALRTLRIPGVVRLLDEGVDDGRAFLVMERVHGSNFPGAGPIRGWDSLAAPTLGLLETLGRVHAAGVVHRDLKPANVLVNKAGQPTVLDFGLSYFDSAHGEGPTREGEMVGTPAYLAPEQINGDPVSARTDLYALGVMLYEAMSGRLPHEARDMVGLMRARMMQRPTPIRDLVPDAPEIICDVIDGLLAANPSERPRSAAEVIAALRGQPAAADERFPRLGTDAALTALIDAAMMGRSVDLVGDTGSGRTRVLRELADSLAAMARPVMSVQDGRRAFSSLASIVGTLVDHPTDGLATVTEVIEAQLRDRLRGGTVLMVDDADRIDPASSAVLARCADAGVVIRVYGRDAALPSPSERSVVRVQLEPLGEKELRPLFAGPDRLFHFREDAARVLLTRTDGNPARVVHEIDTWIRAGLCRWHGEQIVIDGIALDRLEGGLQIAPSIGAPGTPWQSLPAHLEDLLAWITMAWPHSHLIILSAAMDQPPWRIEAEANELVARGAARVLSTGVLEPRLDVHLDDVWPADRKQAAHRCIARVLPPGTQARWMHHVACSVESDSATAMNLAREAIEVSTALARDGHVGKAVIALGEGLRAIRRFETDGQEETGALLAAWVEIALSDATPRALDGVLYEICRAQPRTESIAHLEALVRAALAVGVWSDRALDMIEAVGPFADPALERQRHGVRVAAARRSSQSREEALIEELTRWAANESEPRTRASLAGWTGRLRYRQGRFEEAALLQLQAESGETWTTARMSAQLNAASAFMESARYDDAARWANAARQLARRCRHAFPEARAEWILRCTAYRTGQATSVDLELADAVAHLGAPNLEALVCLNEAGVAWRAGKLSIGRELSQRAYRIWMETGESLAISIAIGLLAACGGEVTPRDIEAVCARSLEGSAPEIAIQALGLLAEAGKLPDEWDSRVDGLTGRIARRSWDVRHEVLSVRESVDRIRAATRSQAG